VFESWGGTATVTGTATAPAGAAGSPANLALTNPGGGASVAVTVAGSQPRERIQAGTSPQGSDVRPPSPHDDMK
jgi:hypothetical protein